MIDPDEADITIVVSGELVQDAEFMAELEPYLRATVAKVINDEVEKLDRLILEGS